MANPKIRTTTPTATYHRGIVTLKRRLHSSSISGCMAALPALPLSRFPAFGGYAPAGSAPIAASPVYSAYCGIFLSSPSFSADW